MKVFFNPAYTNFVYQNLETSMQSQSNRKLANGHPIGRWLAEKWLLQ